MDDNRPPIGPGDNEPPADLDPLLERLNETHAELIERRDALLVSIEASPPVIEDEETAGEYADFVDKQLNAFLKEASAIHETEKAPFLQAGRTVDNFKHMLVDDVLKGKKRVNATREEYAKKKAAEEKRRRDEEARLAREEQDRVEREAREKAAAAENERQLAEAVQAEDEVPIAAAVTQKAEKAAAAKPAELGKSRGQYGGQTSLKQFWNVGPINRDTLDLEALRQHFTDESLKKAVNSWKNAHIEGLENDTASLRGVRIFSDTKL